MHYSLNWSVSCTQYIKTDFSDQTFECYFPYWLHAYQIKIFFRMKIYIKVLLRNILIMPYKWLKWQWFSSQCQAQIAAQTLLLTILPLFCFYSQTLVIIDRLPWLWSPQKHLASVSPQKSHSGWHQLAFNAGDSGRTLTPSFEYWSTFVMRMSYSICYNVIKNQYPINFKWTAVSVWFWVVWKRVNRPESQFSYQSSIYGSSLVLNVVKTSC